MQASSKLEIDARIIDANLYLHKSKVVPAIVDAHNEAIRKAPIKYPITRSEVRSFNIPSGVHDVVVDNFVSGQLPRRMFIMFVRNTAYNSSILEDPFKFDHFNINHIACYINGVQYSNKAFTTNFNKGKYMREYLGLFEALN